MTAPAPRFVVLDGGEGCGKSTQARLLAAYLTTRGVPVVRTLEPGDTPLGWRLRRLLLEDRELEMTPLAEACLFWADRAEHVARVIVPALREAEQAVEAAEAGEGPVELLPQNAYLRRLQHELVGRHHLVSRSVGREPRRRVLVMSP